MIKATFACALVAFGVMVAACAGGGSEDSADGNSEECSSDSDCKGDRVCSDGECVDNSSNNGGSTSNGPPAPNGGAPPTDCSEVDESCDTDPCCGDAICVNYGGSIGNSCGDVCTLASQCQSGCCTLLENGGGVCANADYCQVGAPCDSGENCLTDGCVGWCSDFCSNSDQCPGNSWCLGTTSNEEICFIGCDSSADCVAYPGTSCQNFTSVDGYDINVCSA